MIAMLNLQHGLVLLSSDAVVLCDANHSSSNELSVHEIRTRGVIFLRQLFIGRSA